MSDRLLTYHRLACDWPDCKETAQDDEYDGNATYEEAVRQWAYLPDEPENWCLDKDWMHDPATGKDYCSDHWHWSGRRRVPGPDPRWQS